MNRELSDPERIELTALCGALADDTLDPSEKETLNALLRTGDEARQYYLRHAALSASLFSYAAELQSEAPAPMPVRKASIPRPMWWAAAAAVVVLSAIVWQQQRHERPEALTSPFDYRLNLFDGTETKSKPVDLPETFHYLIGLKVATRRWLERKTGKVTHRYLHVTGTANGDGKRVAVLWRSVPSTWKEADYQADKEWAREMQLFDGADRGWYNGPGTLLDAQPLDSEFRRLLFA